MGNVTSYTLLKRQKTYKHSRSWCSQVDIKPAKSIQKYRTMSSTAVQPRLWRHLSRLSKVPSGWRIVMITHWPRGDDSFRWRPNHMKRRKRGGNNRRECSRARLQRMKRGEQSEEKRAHRKSHQEWKRGIKCVQRTGRQATKGEVPTIKKFIVEQREDEYCRDAKTQIELSGSGFNAGHNSLLARRSKICVFLQNVPLAMFRDLIIHGVHYSPITGHSGKRPM